jgi:hypothetical protein
LVIVLSVVKNSLQPYFLGRRGIVRDLHPAHDSGLHEGQHFDLDDHGESGHRSLYRTLDVDFSGITRSRGIEITAAIAGPYPQAEAGAGSAGEPWFSALAA